MLYWGRRRRRIAHQRSLPSPLSWHVGKESQLSSVEQLPFSEDLSLSPDVTPLPQYSLASIASGPASRPFPIRRTSDPFDLSSLGERSYASDLDAAPVTPAAFIDSPYKSRSLADDQMGQMYCIVPKSPTTSFYQPLIIPGKQGKYGQYGHSFAIARPHRSKKLALMVHISFLCLCFFVFISVLMIVSPVGGDEHLMNMEQIFQPALRASTTKGNYSLPVWARVATATAITQDGYDPGGIVSYPYVNAAPLPANASDAVHMNRFFVGQCTYWVNSRYHQLTGHWIPWSGDASAWAYQALSYGWIVANRPNQHGYSIMVIQPQLAGAGSYGHVAVVEHTNKDGSVYTSSWNWHKTWGITTYNTFTPQTGVSFVWFP